MSQQKKKKKKKQNFSCFVNSNGPEIDFSISIAINRFYQFEISTCEDRFYCIGIHARDIYSQFFELKIFSVFFNWKHQTICVALLTCKLNNIFEEYFNVEYLKIIDWTNKKKQKTKKRCHRWYRQTKYGILTIGNHCEHAKNDYILSFAFI